MPNLSINMRYDWKPILTAVNQTEYLFPSKISPYMKTQHCHPAIYRWNIFEKIPNDLKRVYIGETSCLCPSRIRGYLNPEKTQQTNIRIKKLFDGYLAKGYKIRLEILVLENFSVGEQIFSEADFTDKNIRRMIEHLIINITKREGFEALNI